MVSEGVNSTCSNAFRLQRMENMETDIESGGDRTYLFIETDRISFTKSRPPDFTHLK
jgi:hypothetical protein